MNIMFTFIFFILFVYCMISLIEWVMHHYAMHGNGIVKLIMEYYNLQNCHIDHHKEAKLDQSLPDDFIEEGIVFNIMDVEIIGIVVFLFLSSYLYWQFVPGFKKSFSMTFIFVFIVLVSNLYYYTWSSIHSHYHKRYIEANQPLKNNPTITVHSPLRFFIPNESSSIYKYLFWYHTLHHLNKSNPKCNYNIICPFFDFIFGSYRSKVDNTLYFSKHNPTTEREKWLKTHSMFEIRITDKNTIEYLEKGKWNELPAL